MGGLGGNDSGHLNHLYEDYNLTFGELRSNHFHAGIDIKTKGAEKDDCAMLKEILSRRFKRALLEKGNYLSMPDLLLIDGGKGQYSTAKEVLNEFWNLVLYSEDLDYNSIIAKGNQKFEYENQRFQGMSRAQALKYSQSPEAIRNPPWIPNPDFDGSIYSAKVHLFGGKKE